VAGAKEVRKGPLLKKTEGGYDQGGRRKSGKSLMRIAEKWLGGHESGGYNSTARNWGGVLHEIGKASEKT